VKIGQDKRLNGRAWLLRRHVHLVTAVCRSEVTACHDARDRCAF
jgi:hypothetical protein